MMLFIDKIVAKTPKGLCLLAGCVCMVLSIFLRPHTHKELIYVEGVISEYIEEISKVFYNASSKELPKYVIGIMCKYE